MESGNNSLTLEYSPSGRNGKVTLTAKLGGEVLAVESLNLTKPKQRTAFAQAVCKRRPGIDAAAVEAELLRLAAEVASKPDGAPADLGALPEIDVSSIVRPERFITPEVSGLAVPTMTTLGDKPVGRWILHLRWSDGRREQRPLPTSIDLPEGRRLWIHPSPSEPTANTPAGWSRQGRRAWLQGAAAPDPADVFRRLCKRVAHFIDLPKEHAPGVIATLALWVLLSYCYLAWDALPYLYLGGPLGSGKSRVFEILARLVFRPLGSSNMSGPALFRTLHSQGGTLLLDEAERLKADSGPRDGGNRLDVAGRLQARRAGDADETLLRILADAVRIGERPTPHDILTKAQQSEPAVFKNWYPRTVTSRRKAYGIPTPKKSGSRREFRDVTADTLRRIQTSYGIDLDVPSDATDTTGQP